VLVLLAWGAAALAPMLSGHAGTAPPQWLSRPAVVLHMLGLVYWVGALVPLALLLSVPGDAALVALRRFSRQIPYAVVAVLGGGVVLALLQMGPPGPAWQSAYAELLAAKLALVAVLLGLAAFNRLRLTRPVLAGEAVATRRLRRSIGIELVLVLAIFGLVAGWRFTPPPRVIAELASRPAEVHLHGEAAMADVTLLPGRAGPAELSVFVSDAALGALVPRSIKASFSNPALGIENLARSLEPGADGFWRASVALPSGGAWRIALDVRIDDFTMTRLEGDLELNP
jgi:copper transport protein